MLAAFWKVVRLTACDASCAVWIALSESACTVRASNLSIFAMLWDIVTIASPICGMQGAVQLLSSLQFSTFRSMVLNHGRYRNLGHLNLRLMNALQTCQGHLQAKLGDVQVSVL